MNNCLVLIGCMAISLSFSADAGERYAVVVGVTSYRSGQPLPELAYAENDANRLATVLELSLIHI